MKTKLSKAERIAAYVLGDLPAETEPVFNLNHPFLRKLREFMKHKTKWSGSATELLKAVGDDFTPHNTVTKLLNKYEDDLLQNDKLSIRFHRSNQKRYIIITKESDCQ